VQRGLDVEHRLLLSVIADYLWPLCQELFQAIMVTNEVDTLVVTPISLLFFIHQIFKLSFELMEVLGFNLLSNIINFIIFSGGFNQFNEALHLYSWR
jgi:hypothetical protein